ncbi:hypothetical protein EMIT0111MI5_30183 [Burkholderia sp. IT-111MI5]
MPLMLRPDGQRRRQRRHAGDVERRAVRKHARAGLERQFAECQRFPIDVVAAETPEERAQGRAAPMRERFEIPLLLLKQLRAQEKPLTPDNFVIPTHLG